jgi:hypothetical protein
MRPITGRSYQLPLVQLETANRDGLRRDSRRHGVAPDQDNDVFRRSTPVCEQTTTLTTSPRGSPPRVRRSPVLTSTLYRQDRINLLTRLTGTNKHKPSNGDIQHTRKRPRRSTPATTSSQSAKRSRRTLQQFSDDGSDDGSDDDSDTNNAIVDDPLLQMLEPIVPTRSIPFQSGDLRTPVHDMDNPVAVLPGTTSSYCFLCATSNETARTLDIPSAAVAAGEYTEVDAGRLRLRRIARCNDYDQLLNMITSNIGRMDEDCLLRAIKTFYDSKLKQYVPGTPEWPLRVIREHIRDHELNSQWQAWTSASDIRTMIRINLNNGVCVTNSATDVDAKLDIPRVKLHIQLLRQLEREVAKATASTT